MLLLPSAALRSRVAPLLFRTLLPGILCASMVPLLVASGVASPLFAPQVEYPVGSRPSMMTMGDLNGDGRPDLVAVNQISNDMSVLLNNGDGTFQTKMDYAVGSNPYAVAIGDLNGDLDADIVVVNASSATVSIFLGNGDGTLGPRTDFVTNGFPSNVAIGDLNNDLAPDLAVTNGALVVVQVMLGNGDGTFGAPTSFATGSSPRSVAIADFNGDFVPDLAVASQLDDAVSILIGTGSGSFGSKMDYPTGSRPQDVIATDLDGDLQPDLVTANLGCSGDPTGTTVSVLLGNGDGSFGADAEFAVGDGPYRVAFGDFNQDGRKDLVAANWGCGVAGVDVSVLLGNGDGTFLPKIDVATPRAVSVVVGDLNGDGRHDLATANYHPDDNSVSVLLATYAPALVSVRDVPDDQGGKVRVLWDSSFLDTAPLYTIGSYNLWRRVLTTAAVGAIRQGARIVSSGLDLSGLPGTKGFRVTTQGTQTLFWEFIASVPARGVSGYGYTVQTTSDSMASDPHWNVFFVDAQEAASPTFYVSPVDSGYSVDNLAPGVPAAFAAAYQSGATHLQWGPGSESDLCCYRLYRGGSAGFVPGPENLIATATATDHADPGPAGRYYKLSAVDVHGNESGFALVTPEETTDVADAGPLGFALETVRPNPTSGPGFAVHFVLAKAAPARLELIDASGRRVAQHEVGSLGAGRHTLELGKGGRLAPGIYLVRLSQGTSVKTTRVAVLD